MCEDEIEYAKNYFRDTVAILLLLLIVLFIAVLEENGTVQDKLSQTQEIRNDGCK